MAQSRDSQGQDPAKQTATASNAESRSKTISLWASGGRLEVNVGNRQYVAVPNPSGREPTREEIYDALVAAGHQERASELADKAYGDVTGTNP